MKRLLFIIIGLVALGVIFAMAPAKRKTAPRKKVEDKKVYLVHSDRLHYDQYQNGDAQVLNGNVHFRHQGADLFCDSAHFYQESNSFEAFGHVKMKQGDTLSLTSDYAYYDGNAQLAQARYNVVLRHRKSTLYTDSLDYDRMYNFGNFFEGGKLVDGNTTLTSDWGEYHTDTKQAMFYYDVRLKDNKLFMTTDSLFYNTQTSMAHIVGPSNITSGTSHIYSEDGFYNTKTEQSELFGRSVISDQGRILIGDSVYHNATDGTNYAYWNVVYNDTVNKNMMTGDYCEYNDSTGYAMATKRAVTIDYSQQDSLFMHADTFKIFTFNIRTDSVYRKIHAYNKVRAYRTDIQAVCDSLVYNTKDSCMTMYKDPIIWNQQQQLVGELVKVYMRDSTIDHAHVIGQAFSAEQLHDSIHFNQISSKEMKTFFVGGEAREFQAIDNVLVDYFYTDEEDSVVTLMNYLETPLLKMFLKDRKMERIWTSKASGVYYPLNQVPADKNPLPGFAWFDYVRPLNKEDIFNWRPKKEGTELKEIKRREPPKRVRKTHTPTPTSVEPTPTSKPIEPIDSTSHE